MERKLARVRLRITIAKLAVQDASITEDEHGSENEEFQSSSLVSRDIATRRTRRLDV